MRFISANDCSKAKHGVTSGLKLAGHVSMACATTPHYARCELSPNELSGSRSVENILEIVSIDDLRDSDLGRGIPSAMGCGSRRNNFMSRKTHAFSSTVLPETGQLPSSPVLSKSAGRASHSHRGLTLSLADLRILWPSSKIHQVFVTHIEWFDDAKDDNNFLLLRLSSMIHGAPQWLRLERHLQTSGLKGAAAWINPIGHSLADDRTILSSDLSDVMPQESTCVPRETISKPTPLSFILDVLDAVHRNCRPHRVASMGGDRIFLSIIMNALHRFHAPSNGLTNKTAAQSNNPYRILGHLAQRRACTKLAQQVEIQDGWEMI